MITTLKFCETVKVTGTLVVEGQDKSADPTMESFNQPLPPETA